MATSNTRKSKQDKLLEGTINILKDNKKKLDVMNKLNSANLRNDTIINAKITLISYLVECCYDIILSKQHNVSESPGYEKIVKQFGRRQE